MPETRSQEFRWTLAALLIAAYLFGIGFATFLPPFDAHDEIAHYSRIKELADTNPDKSHHAPQITTAAISYATSATMPYGWCYDHLGKLPCLTYQEFARHPETYPQYISTYGEVPFPAESTMSTETNWEYQHPPLYYALFATIDRQLETLPFLTELLILRLMSWTLAFAGFLIGLRATYKYLIARAPDAAPRTILFAALYPFILPMFFPEFARVGNDCLLLFLFGIIWSVLLAYLRDDHRDSYPIIIGAFLGMAAYTKLFGFVMCAALVAFFIARAGLYYHQDRRWPRSQWRTIGFIAGGPLCVILLCYVPAYLSGGFPGSIEIRNFIHSGGSPEDLMFHINWHAVLSYWDFTLHSVIWSVPTSSLLSTESLTATVFYKYALIVLPFLALVLYCFSLTRAQLLSEAWLPLFLVVPFFMGFALLICVTIAAGKVSPIPGWYLHIIAPALSLAFARGLSVLAETRAGRLVITASLIVSSSFILTALWAHAALYGGCLGIDQHRQGFENGAWYAHHTWYIPYIFSAPSFCVGRWNEIMAQLHVLTWPNIAFPCFAVGGILMAAGMTGIVVCLNRKAT